MKSAFRIQLLKQVARILRCVLILAGGAFNLVTSERAVAAEVFVTQTNEGRLHALVLKPQCTGVSVDLDGQILWVDARQNELDLQTGAGVLRVKMDLFGQPALAVGQRVHLSGSGLAGQGILDAALADNDGLHPVKENSGTVYLTAGLHPIRAEWFNARFDFSFAVEYSGPSLARQQIPAGVLYRDGTAAGNGTHYLPGLNYRCYQGDWEQLPHWLPSEAVASGSIADFDLSTRTRDQAVGLQFTGYLKVDKAGDYTFWTKSDDGSRLYLEDCPLRLSVSGRAPLPSPRVVQAGQALNPGDDFFWASVRGTVTAIHIDAGGKLELELSAGTNHMYVDTDSVPVPALELSSQVQAAGLCRAVHRVGGGYVTGRLLVAGAGQIKELAPAPASSKHAAMTFAELRRLAASGQRTGSPLSLKGTVLAVDAGANLFALQDETGGMVVQMNRQGEGLEPGQQIILTGTGALDGNRLFLSHAAVIDNDGVHLRQEKTGAIFLHAGKHSIRVSWFNRVSPCCLEVYYQSPDLPRQRISNSALFHSEIDPSSGTLKWMQGLNYRYYIGDWQKFPDTSDLDPVAMGTVANFDIRVAEHLDKAALEFDGYLDVPRDGPYLFSVASDDGSLLSIDEQAPRIQAVGTNALPLPRVIAPRQILSADQNYQWSEVEGEINFAYERAGSLFLELNSVYGPMSIEVVDGAGGSPLLMLGGRVRVQGFCQQALMPEGPGMATTMVTLGMQQVRLVEAASLQWNRYPLQTIAEAVAKPVTPASETIVHVRGTARARRDGHALILTDTSGTMAAETAQPLADGLRGPVEVIGRLSQWDTNKILQCAIYRKLENSAGDFPTNLPVLTTVLQIKQLVREQAQHGYPVKIRGVITLVRGNGSGFIIQDDTAAIDVWWSNYSNPSLPRVGDFWEVDGNTFAEFSPNIRTSHAIRLGSGAMPEPLHPTWDQLLNGSLDTRYVELQGIVTATDAEGVELLTRTGKIRVLLSQMNQETLKQYENALVRIRGCVVPLRDQLSQQVLVGQLRLSNASVNVDEPAPLDPFAAIPKHASELLMFDVRAGSLERVKIAGQIVHVRGDELFLLDGTNAIHVLSANSVAVQAGDLVEVVGFPELGGPSPILREAILRHSGRAPLPTPVSVATDSLFAKGRDGTLISVKARLIGISGNEREKVLELQAGGREFVARLNNIPGTLKDLLPGSWLQLAGVYSEPTGGLPEQWLSSFELLLNSPDDVKVLARPPWWTLRRALVFAGGLAVIIMGGLFWIVILRRRVEENAMKLALEVRRREQVQQQNVLEKERTRIAKDMHDQLGTNVTRVGLLAELAKQNAGDPGKITAHAEKICQTAFELGRTLDEIVWAVNPKNDSLDKFCDYMAVQAQELFQLTNTLCRVDLPPEMPEYPLSAEVRHNLFLATKEALNNVVRHANAEEVWVRFKLTSSIFRISIVDNGAGFVFEPKHALRNGLQNMKKRLEDAGGSFTVASRPGEGTEVTMAIGLVQEAAMVKPDLNLRS